MAVRIWSSIPLTRTINLSESDHPIHPDHLYIRSGKGKSYGVRSKTCLRFFCLACAEEPGVEEGEEHAADGEFEPDGRGRWREEALKAAGDYEHGDGSRDE